MCSLCVHACVLCVYTYLFTVCTHMCSLCAHACVHCVYTHVFSVCTHICSLCAHAWVHCVYMHVSTIEWLNQSKTKTVTQQMFVLLPCLSENNHRTAIRFMQYLSVASQTILVCKSLKKYQNPIELNQSSASHLRWCRFEENEKQLPWQEVSDGVGVFFRWRLNEGRLPNVGLPKDVVYGMTAQVKDIHQCHRGRPWVQRSKVNHVYWQSHLKKKRLSSRTKPPLV